MEYCDCEDVANSHKGEPLPSVQGVTVEGCVGGHF